MEQKADEKMGCVGLVRDELGVVLLGRVGVWGTLDSSVWVRACLGWVANALACSALEIKAGSKYAGVGRGL